MSKLYALLVHPENGYTHSVESAKQLEHDKHYEVDRVSMGQSHTNIFLKGIKGLFSSVQFEFYDEANKPVDIFKMPEYNPYLGMFGEEVSHE